MELKSIINLEHALFMNNRPNPFKLKLPATNNSFKTFHFNIIKIFTDLEICQLVISFEFFSECASRVKIVVLCHSVSNTILFGLIFVLLFTGSCLPSHFRRNSNTMDSQTSFLQDI